MREFVVSAVMLTGAFGLWMSAGVHRDAPLVEHRGMTSEVAAMENAVALNPNDPEKLSSLCSAYLEREAPGFALAAIHRAPETVRQQPPIHHLWARALLHEGQASDALAKQRYVLAECERTRCSAWLVASATRHEAFLSAMVARGVEDYRRNPDETVEAYRFMKGSTVAVLDHNH